MTHHITDTDSMMSVREVPWHGLGRIVQDAPTAADAIVQAGLDWTVDPLPLFAARGEDIIDVTGWRAATRSDNGHVIGVVGDGYATVQNREAFDFADVLAGGGDVTYETAGSLDGGRRVWMLARLDGRMVMPVTGDETVPYLLLSNSHDGSSSLRAMLTMVRVVCHNTQTLAHRQGACIPGMDVKIRHSGDVAGKIAAARNVFAQAIKGVDAYSDAASLLARTKMGEKVWADFLDAVFPVADDAVRTGRTDNMRNRVMELAEAGTGMDIPGVRGTAWAALNAVTEYVTHERSTRAAGGRAADDAKLEAVLFGSGAALNATAFDWLVTRARTGELVAA